MRVVEFVRPAGTLAISVTGRRCGLGCAHCGGHYLKGMAPAGDAPGLLRGGPPGNSRRGRFTSCLVSGGCDAGGRVPVLRDPRFLEELKGTGLRLNFHTGLVTGEEAREIGKWADCVSFDLVGDDETVAEVFGIARPAQDYVESYERLRRYARVVPHICVGLRGGRISGEYRALDYIARAENPPDQVVFIIFIPTPGTLYEKRTPPDAREVADLVRRARRELPSAKLSLGCMRPGGRYRSEVDVLCLEEGVDAIVNPSREAREYARRQGIEVVTKRECCVF